MLKKTLFPAAVMMILCLTGCSTGRDLTSPHYIPEWENKLINFPSPSDTSGGRWVIESGKKVGKGIENTVLFPFAVAGNAAVNAYYIPTWPLRAIARGDNRLIVWHPLFGVGSTVGSDFYSKEWNTDLV